MKKPKGCCVFYQCWRYAELRYSSVKVISVGVKRPAECRALEPLVADLNSVQFPNGWTIFVACTASAWDDAVRQLDTWGRTNVAMTSQARHFTVINGAVYSPAFDWTRTRQRTGKEILRHELGHIFYRDDEDEAGQSARTVR